MTDTLKDIIDKIDKGAALKYTGKYYGIAELINANSERYPVTVGTKRDRINAADTWQLQTYHRILASTELPNQTEFGKKIGYNITVVMVVIANPNMGEDFIYRFKNDLPVSISVGGSYAVMNDGVVVNNDHEAIAITEFGQTFEDKHRLTKNIWTITYTLNLTYCL